MNLLKKFEERGCELLETEYSNNSTKMNYRCNCGNESSIRWGYFQKGKRCFKCSGSEKFKYQFVKNYFTEKGCELLETKYTDTDTKMKYICICSNASIISFYNFRKGHRCKFCSGNEKKTIEFIKIEFLKKDCELLETEYIDNRTKMKYKCKNNHIAMITWDSFQRGNMCIDCCDTKKLTLEFVKKEFEKKGCKLLETKYKNAKTKIKYICKCNIESVITWDSFQSGVMCKMCGYEKQEKSLWHYKDYMLPSQKIIRIQGYENIALDELVQKYQEDDIITDRRNMPEIVYILKGKYYPDIWIKSINKIIEVKSLYTYRQYLIKNISKALQLGFHFEFWIYTPEKQKTFSKQIV